MASQEKFDNIMIDIETMGTRPGCVILQLGAVEFNDKDVNINNQFYAAIDMDASVNWGMHLEPGTVKWWLQQDQLARDFITKGTTLDPITAYTNFIKSFRWNGKKVWCKGASFDFPIITEALRLTDHKAPWNFWDQMDMRTIENLLDKKSRSPLKVAPAVAHNALSDAISQAQTLINYAKHLGIKL